MIPDLPNFMIKASRPTTDPDIDCEAVSLCFQKLFSEDGGNY
jgi:hypothetical protein